MLVGADYDLTAILACPRCKSPLKLAVAPTGEDLFCINRMCDMLQQPFMTVRGKSVLVDFDRSIINARQLIESKGETLVPRGKKWRKILDRLANGTNKIAPFWAGEIIRTLETKSSGKLRPLVLVIGGGSVGAGSESLYISSAVDVLAFDVYASPYTHFIADAHSIPLKSESVDAVWIQAVLEHLTDPPQAVEEIHRVLKSDGLVFADTPFLWPVHERAYDFTRYTPSGHRWLFRKFDVVGAGTSSGPGTSLVLALRYLVASLTRSSKIGHFVALPFAWIRLLDRYCDSRRGLDAAAGLFFFGRKRAEGINREELIIFYDEQIGLQKQAKASRFTTAS